MKIALAASAGGHLAQIKKIFSEDFIDRKKIIYLTDLNEKTKNNQDLDYKFNIIYQKANGYIIPFYIPAIIKCIRVFLKEKVKLVVTTGAEIGIAALVAAKILGIKTIFIETVIRVKTPTVTGKICYYFSNIFLVQNKELLKKYGKKAQYQGAII